MTWIRQVCDALIYMHSQNPPLIHGDIKPSNIRITPQGNAVLVDFGLKRFFNDGTKNIAGMRRVTQHFAAPELYGTSDPDSRSDIYSLGVTLFCMLTYRVPPISVDILAGNAKASPPAKSINPSIPDSVNRRIAPRDAVAPRRASKDAGGVQVRADSGRKNCPAGRTSPPVGSDAAACHHG